MPRLFHRPRPLPAWRAAVGVIRPLGVPRDRVPIAPAALSSTAADLGTAPLARRGVHLSLVVVTSRGTRILERVVTPQQLTAKRRQLEQILDLFDPPAPAVPTLRLVRGGSDDATPR